MKRESTGEYPSNWDEIASQIKEQAGWKCVRCQHSHDPENGYTLTVHHLDMKPANCEWWNIPPLCQRCHLHIQAKVMMEQLYMFEHSAWFKPYAAGYYAAQHGEETTREYVEANLERLLEYGKPCPS